MAKARTIRLMPDIFPVPVEITVGGSGDEWARRVARRYGVGECNTRGLDGCTMRLESVRHGTNRCVVWMRHWRFGAIVHELAHVTHHIMRIVGADDEETYCYLLEWLCRNAARKLKRARS